MHFFWQNPCIFSKSTYLCNVFFIVLDLRLTRLGYSGIPFFLPYTLGCSKSIIFFMYGFDKMNTLREASINEKINGH